MANLIHIDLDDVDSHLVEPPMVDLILEDTGSAAWNITFIPESTVSSKRRTRVVASSGNPGHRVQVQIDRLSRLLNHPVVKIVHSGGRRFHNLFRGTPRCVPYRMMRATAI